MKLFVKFDFNAICTQVLQEQLEALGLQYKLDSFGEITFNKQLKEEQVTELSSALSRYRITIVEDQKSILVQKIKDTIVEIVYNTDEDLQVKSSVYLSEKLGHSYGYLSNLFSEVTYSSIENFTILQKIEYAKQLILQEDKSLTEIAFQLNYSSVAHLSTQFKNTTGITPTAFQRIIGKRKNKND